MGFMDGTGLGLQAAQRLAELQCCDIEPGLTDEEFARIEQDYDIEFADDHRAFLGAGLPVREPPQQGQTWENPWPDWRDGNAEELRAHINWPIDFLLSDIQRGHWRTEWGERPATADEALRIARIKLIEAPKMVPIFAHRFLPAGRGTFGHPVLSMRGRDVICYGSNLFDYINQEFQEPRPDHEGEWPPRVTVAFWRNYLRSY
jgi:hypothetical protein